MLGPVKQLGAFTSNPGHPQIETEDTGVGILQFENNAVGIIYGTTASFPGQMRRMEISGTKGTIVLQDDSLQVWQFAEMKKEDEEIITNYGKTASASGVSDPAAISFINHAQNISGFIRAIEEKRNFEIDGTEARKAVSLILDIYSSSRQKVFINCTK
jgi:predicted dehydrogenase